MHRITNGDSTKKTEISDLEFAVDLSETDGGGIFECSIGFSKARECSHSKDRSTVFIYVFFF